MGFAKDEASRRTFLGQTGLALGAAVLAPGVAGAGAAPTTAPATKPAPAADLQQLNATAWVNLQQTGWNLYATRFVDPPTWSWKPIDNAAAYVVQFAHEQDKTARTLRLDKPLYDMSREWPSIDEGCIDMIAWAVDGQGVALCVAWRKRFWKSPGFDGIRQEPMDYKASVDANLAYLLAPARDEVREFERGLPRSCWAATEDSITGRRRLLGFPALHHPSFIFAYLTYAEDFPDSPHTSEAVRQAKQYGDWLLANRSPADWACALFPFSTVQNGRPAGYIEGRNITLFRAARVGEAMVKLFRFFKDEKYLAYARHLADTYVRLQRPDGSWPYRVDPKDAKVVEDYTSNAVTPARLLAALERIEANPAYAEARRKAIRWVMENPVRTRRWQGMYEDVGVSAPYRNLQHFDTDELISYLVHFHRDEPESVRVAEELNRYIEDQFVVWKEGDRAIADRCPAPTVLEQYVCYRPMESHTAIWIGSLIALHRATGKDEYLVKAINAGNAIVRAQQPGGAYSTWGYDARFGRSLLTLDWPGCNAFAVSGLLRLMRYVKSLPQSRQEEHPL